MGVVDLNTVDERADVGFAERHLARRQPLAHDPGEAIDGQRTDVIRATCCRPGAVEGRRRRRLCCLQGRDPILQDLIHLGESVLDQPVQPAQPLFSILRLARQRRNPPIDGDLPIGAPPGQGGQHR
ncbi:MAG: hypothetical protein AB7K67_17335 [Hyphomicrobiaceae bacterium]